MALPSKAKDAANRTKELERFAIAALKEALADVVIDSCQFVPKTGPEGPYLVIGATRDGQRVVSAVFLGLIPPGAGVEEQNRIVGHRCNAAVAQLRQKLRELYD